MNVIVGNVTCNECNCWESNV